MIETAVSQVRETLLNISQRDEVSLAFGGQASDVRLLYERVKDCPIYSKYPWKNTVRPEEFLAQLPLLTKNDLRNHFPNGFLHPSENFIQLIEQKKVEVVRTSGTSSDRLQVLWDTGWWDRHEKTALQTNSFIEPYMSKDYREAVLTTPLCSDSVCKTGPLSMNERIVDYMLFLNTNEDPTRWTSDDLERMLSELEQFCPVALEADPGYLAPLARYLRTSQRRIPKLQWIILTYEFVSAIHKKLIRSVYQCPVFEFYGLTEAGVFFLECLEGGYHFCGQDSLVEILRPRSFSTLPNNLGEVVVTTWGNRAEPLLRYRTHDLVVWKNDPCACGVKGSTLVSFEGRIGDCLEFPGGDIFTPRQIDGALKDIGSLAQYLCIQGQPNSVVVEYVRDGQTDPGPEIEDRLHVLWKRVNVTAREVSFIAPEPSGKYRTVKPL